MLSSVLSTTTEADIVKTPFAYARVTLSKMEYIELKSQVNQWHSQWLRARQREREALAQIAQIKVKHQEEISAFQVQIDQLKNQLAQMQHLVFGRSTEKTSKKSGNQQEGSGSGQKSDRKKGQQKGSKGHGRKNVTTLPVIPDRKKGQQKGSKGHGRKNEFLKTS